MKRKSSVELKQEIKAVYDEIEEKNSAEEPDFDGIDALEKDLEGLERQLKTATSIEKRKAEYLEETRKVAQMAQVNAGAEDTIPADELSVYKNFSIIRAIGQIKKHQGLRSGTAEEEAYAISEEEAVHSSVKLIGNIGIPQKLIRFPGRKVVTVGTEGGDIVDTMFGPKIPLLEIDPKVIRAGSRLFTAQTSDLQFPRGSVGATVAWYGEVDESQATTPEYDNIQLTPNRLANYTDYSIQADTQATFDLEADLRERLANAAAIEWDRATLVGAGSGISDPITGIINQPGVGVVPLTGNAVDWATALKYPASLGDANVDIEGPVSYMSSASVRAHLMSSPKDPGSGQFVMTEAGQVAGFPYWMNNNVPQNGGVGTDEHTMVYGKWSDNYMAQWAGTSILYDPFTQATKGTVRLVLNLYLDSNIAHPESFVYSADIIP